MPTRSAALYVHGGVSGTRSRLASPSHAVEPALEAPTALDMVEEAVKRLEDDPSLNAGFGSVLDRRGGLEMDAGIAEGHTGRFGGIANVTVRNPISLARRVLESTPHVLVTGRGAMELAFGMEMLASTTDHQIQRWRDAKDAGGFDPEEFGREEYVDTVGAVALDPQGNLAAGSSTGGVFGKLPGRVGDAPVFGAGFYASGSVAVVGTGVGELFLATLACFRVGDLVERGTDPQSACEQGLEAILVAGSGTAGLLALDRSGRVGAVFRGAAMSVAGPAGSIAAARVD